MEFHTIGRESSRGNIGCSFCQICSRDACVALAKYGDAGVAATFVDSRSAIFYFPMELLLSITLFAGFGAAFVLINLVMGAVARPKIPNPEKLAVYECGEPSIGSSWVQFDLRFYIVALVYLIFDVEVALFYPWAVAYGSADQLGAANGMSAFAVRQVALVDMLFFFGVLLVGFAYLWRFGYLDWVRSAATTSLKIDYRPGIDLRSEARIDRA
jgi:NADH-quinone oxidoreductase subunit A